MHFSDQLLYLPFDMTVEDHSAYMRNGYFWNSTMGGFTFDAFDKIKNKSALFDGMVNCFLVLNSLTQNMDELTKNEFNDQQTFLSVKSDDGDFMANGINFFVASGRALSFEKSTNITSIIELIPKNHQIFKLIYITGYSTKYY